MKSTRSTISRNWRELKTKKRFLRDRWLPILEVHTHTHTETYTHSLFDRSRSSLYPEPALFPSFIRDKGDRHNGRVWDGRFKSSDLFEDFSNCFPPMGTVPRDMQIDPRPALLSRFSFVAFGRECRDSWSTATLQNQWQFLSFVVNSGEFTVSTPHSRKYHLSTQYHIICQCWY